MRAILGQIYLNTTHAIEIMGGFRKITQLNSIALALFVQDMLPYGINLNSDIDISHFARSQVFICSGMFKMKTG